MGKQRDSFQKIEHMPFGKFKGDRIDDLPTWYLKWIAENIKDGAVCYAADEEYQLRLKEGEDE